MRLTTTSVLATATGAAATQPLPAATHVACASTGGRILTFEISELKAMPNGGRGLTLIDLEAKDTLAGAAPSEVNGASVPEAAAKPKKNTIKGVNEYYAACAIRLPAHGKRPSADAGLLPARPVALTEKGLVVELIESE